MKASAITSALLVSLSICSKQGHSIANRTLEACTRDGSSYCATPFRSLRKQKTAEVDAENDDKSTKDKDSPLDNGNEDENDTKKSNKSPPSDEDTVEEEDSSLMDSKKKGTKSKKKKQSVSDSE